MFIWLLLCILSLARCSLIDLRSAISKGDTRQVDRICKEYLFPLKDVRHSLKMIFDLHHSTNVEFHLVKALLRGAEECATGLLNSSSTFRRYIKGLSREALIQLAVSGCSSRKWAISSGSPIDHRTLPDDEHSDLSYLKWAVYTSFDNTPCIRRCFTKGGEQAPWLDRYGFRNSSLLIDALRKGFFHNVATIANMFYYEPSEAFLYELEGLHGTKYTEQVTELLEQSNAQYNLFKDVIHGRMDRLAHCLLSQKSCYFSRADGTNLLTHLFFFALEVSRIEHGHFKTLFEEVLAMIDDLLKEPRALRAACRRYGSHYLTYEAARAGNLQLLSVLAMNSVPMTLFNSKRTGTPLHTALLAANRAIPYFLLNEYRGPLALDAPISVHDEQIDRVVDGFTPLHIALSLDDLLTVWDLLARGASADFVAVDFSRSENAAQMLLVWRFFPTFLLFQDPSFLPDGLRDVFTDIIVPYLANAEFLAKT